MRQNLILVFLMAVAVLATGCAGCADTKDGAGEADTAEFDQTMRVADSLHNSMQFRDAYDLYLQLLNNPVAKADSEKKLNVLSSLSNASELSGHKAEETKWLQQQLDLAKETGNGYYHAMALTSMGQNIFFEGDVKDILILNTSGTLVHPSAVGNMKGFRGYFLQHSQHILAGSYTGIQSKNSTDDDDPDYDGSSSGSIWDAN